EQFRGVGREQDPLQVGIDLALLVRGALGDRQQRQVVVAEHGHAVLAQRMHQAQGLQRLAATVHQVAAEPQPVLRRIEADALEQALGGPVAALQVSDRPDAHAIECKRFARWTKSRTRSCSARAPGSTPAAAIASAPASAASALRRVLRRWPKAARTTAAKRAGSSIPASPAGRGRSRTTAESTLGAGRKAPGGTVNSGVTVQ